MSTETKAVLPASFELEGYKDDVNYFLEHGKLSQKGDTFVVSKADTEKWFESRGHTREAMEALKNDIDRIDTIGGIIASSVAEKLVKEKIANGEDASGVRGSFKAATSAFEHGMRMTVSQSVPAGMVKEGEKTERVMKYGQLRSSLTTQGKLGAALVDGAAIVAMRALGVS